MSTLSILNSFSLPTQGRTLTGKQGAADDDVDTAFDITVTGTVHEVIGLLGTAAIKVVYDDDDDVPADWDFMYFWADVDLYIQVVGATSNVIFKVLAKVPFTLTYDSLLAAANTTDITGGSEPTLEDIDHIVIGNYSGGNGNYHFAVVD